MTNKELRALRHALMDAYKLSQGCCICGYNKHPSALCFDHLPEHDKHEITKNGGSKRSNAGGMYRLYAAKYTWEEIIEEVKKCRVMCHNCHMADTHDSNDRRYNPDNHITLDLLIKGLMNLDNVRSGTDEDTN